MSIVLKTVVAVAAMAACSATAGAQGIIQERNISMMLARDIANAAMECTKGGKSMSVAVVDRAGEVVALLRGDGASLYSTELARRKAYTAKAFRRPSLEWAKRTQTDLIGQRSLSQVIPLGGGMPIQVGEETIGGVGVSGTSGGQEGDENCAKSAIAKVADQLK